MEELMPMPKTSWMGAPLNGRIGCYPVEVGLKLTTSVEVGLELLSTTGECVEKLVEWREGEEIGQISLKSRLVVLVFSELFFFFFSSVVFCVFVV